MINLDGECLSGLAAVFDELFKVPPVIPETSEHSLADF